MSEFRPQALANTVWSFATLQYLNDQLMEAISRNAAPKLEQFTPQELANTGWAFAFLAYHDKDLLEAIAMVAETKLSRFAPSELSGTAWAIATLQVANLPLMQAISSAAIEAIAEFSAQSLSNTAWSFATLRLDDRTLLSAISREAQLRIESFHPQALANTGWAFAQLMCPDVPLFEAISSASLSILHTFGPSELATTAWAIARFEGTNSPLLEAIAIAARGRIRDSQMDDFSAGLVLEALARRPSSEDALNVLGSMEIAGQPSKSRKSKRKTPSKSTERYRGAPWRQPHHFKEVLEDLVQPEPSRPSGQSQEVLELLLQPELWRIRPGTLLGLGALISEFELRGEIENELRVLQSLASASSDSFDGLLSPAVLAIAAARLACEGHSEAAFDLLENSQWPNAPGGRTLPLYWHPSCLRVWMALGGKSPSDLKLPADAE
eukprot:TRINITY_DN4217_c0_g1_i3.p1 TRINITY_DN4217_c0_g1~~TRINITY_DN4217_c0_g1_i3.p1  ORF type:complete len:438 (+),score=71.24 TRINITY_DN4217_c0_g1_i3:973-2286(+)